MLNNSVEKNGPTSPSGKKLNRRKFLKLGLWGTFASGLGLGGYAWRYEPHWIQVIRRQLPIRQLPESFVGKTLAHISDLHIGEVVDHNYIVQAMQRVSELEPDIVVITGDLMTCDGTEQLDQLERVIENLKPGTLGTFAIPGNHDYGLDYIRADVVDSLERRLPKHGITLLRNDKATIDGFTIVGIDDLWGPYFQPQQVLPKIDHQAANLVLCHNPDVADLDVWSGYRGWILSGHTHGGQCRFPLLGAPILPVRNKQYVIGEIDLGDGRRMYINPGLGYVQRVRFCVPPEITVFELVREEKKN